MLMIDPTARISKFADIEPSVRGTEIRIAANVMIDSFVKIKPSGGVGPVSIGANSYINSGTVIYTGHGVTIGADVLIAANCTFAPSNHAYADRSRPIRLQGTSSSKGGIIVEDDVWIGANCVILDGARIRRGAIVAAGSVVRGELPAYGIFGGSPATLIRMRPE